MRQSALLSVLLLLVATLPGCGGSKSNTNTPTTVSVSPTTLSLTLGGVAGLTTTLLSSSGTAVSATEKITYSSNNTAVATVSSGGSVCAGTWDANNIVCTPGQVGTATITVSVGSLTGTTTVYAHQKVDRVTVSPASVNCLSMGATQQMSAAAFSNGVDVTSTVGPMTWLSDNTDVATVDANGVVTSKSPGAGSIYAAVANVSSTPASYVTCGVRSIHLRLFGVADTSFTVATGATQQLVADVFDTTGKVITPTLTWFSTQPAVAAVNSSALVTAVAAGTASIGAACSGTCNIGMAPVYGDVVIANINGTSATTVYATGTGTTTLIPIDTGANTAGTAITLPTAPNSFVFAATGTKGYLGSSNGLITLDTSNNTVSQNTGAPGTVLGVSPDSSRVLVASSGVVYSVGTTTDSLNISGATAAAFSADNSRAYILAGTNLYVFTPGGLHPAISLVAAANDAAFLPSSAMAYLAGGAPSAITARASCDASLVDTVSTPGTPSRVGSTPDALKVVAADSPGIDVLTRTAATAPGCPPAVTESLTSVDFGQGAYNARQLIMLPNGAKAYITSNLGTLLAYDIAGGTASSISLAGGASAFTGGATLDSTRLYVGGSDNKVHRIDVASGTDAQQIDLSFTPDLVAVRPK